MICSEKHKEHYPIQLCLEWWQLIGLLYAKCCRNCSTSGAKNLTHRHQSSDIYQQPPNVRCNRFALPSEPWRRFHNPGTWAGFEGHLRRCSNVSSAARQHGYFRLQTCWILAVWPLNRQWPTGSWSWTDFVCITCCVLGVMHQSADRKVQTSWSLPKAGL